MDGLQVLGEVDLNEAPTKPSPGLTVLGEVDLPGQTPTVNWSEYAEPSAKVPVDWSAYAGPASKSLPEVDKAIASVPRPVNPILSGPSPLESFANEQVPSASRYRSAEDAFSPEGVGPRAATDITSGLKTLVPTSTQPYPSARDATLAGAKVAGGVGTLTRPAMLAAAAMNPVTAAVGAATGLGASEAGKGIAKHFGADEDLQKAIGDIAFWVPSLAGEALGLRSGVETSPEGTRGAASILGGKAGVGAAVTPEAVAFRGKVGPFQGEINIPRGGGTPTGPQLEPPTVEGQIAASQSPEVSQAASVVGAANERMAQAARHSAGIPEPQPPAPPPSRPPIPEDVASGHVSPESIQKVAGVLSQLPPNLRSQGMIEAHDTLSKVLQHGPTVVDGKLIVVKTPQEADKATAEIINNAVEALDKAAIEQQKQSEKKGPSIAEGITASRARAKQAGKLEVLGEVDLPSANRNVQQRAGSENGAAVPVSGPAVLGEVDLPPSPAQAAVKWSDYSEPSNQPVESADSSKLTVLGEEHLIKKGDQVVLPGGEKGTVAYIDDDRARVEVPKAEGGTKKVSIPPGKLKAVEEAKLDRGVGNQPISNAKPSAEAPTVTPGAPSNERNIVFARHGATKLDQSGSNETVAGWSAEPLDDRGVAASNKMAASLKDSGVTHIISSDLPRAKQTAEIVGEKLGLTVKTDERLRPQHVPETEGLKIDEAKKIWDYYERHPGEAPKGGESWNQFTTRQDEILKEVEALAKAGKPLVMTHSRNLEAALGKKPEPGGFVESKTGEGKPNVSAKAGAVTAGAESSQPVATKFKYGSTQANIPAESEAHSALETARSRISDSDLAGKGKDVGGNHLTVRYGIKRDDTAGIKNYLASLEPFEASLGKTEKFPPSEHSEGAAVIIAPVEAPELHRINAELEKHGEFTEPSFKEFRPHATLAYVRPERADRYVGMAGTAGKKFTVNSIAITDRNGKQEEVKLQGRNGSEKIDAPGSQPESRMEASKEHEQSKPITEARSEVPNPPRESRTQLAPVEPEAGKPTQAEREPGSVSGRRSGESAASASTSGSEEHPSESSRGISERGTVSAGAESARRGTGEAKQPRVRAKNTDWFTHPEDFDIAAGNTTRLQWNLKALDTLKKILSGETKATDEDREALARYVGWGALQWVFDPYGAPWKEQEKWRAANTKLLEHMGDEQFRAARKSTMNAHYTSPQIVRTIWDAVKAMGFKGGSVLETSMGTGNFFGMMPKEIRGKVNAIGNELDPTTYNIAKVLYPSATLFNKDFSKLILPDNSVDLVVGNVPFGEEIYDPHYPKLKARIHDYFIVKSLDKVRPGGVVAVISSTGTLDKPNSRIREIMADKADLMYALRFPSSTFEKTAGTHVTTDFLVFQKREPGALPGGEAFTKVVPVEAPHEQDKIPAKDFINEYFDKHPENLLGKLMISRRMYGSNDLVLAPDEGASFGDQLKEAISRVPKKLFDNFKSSPAFPAGDASNLAPDSLIDGNLALDKKGNIVLRQTGGLVPAPQVLDKDGKISPVLKDRATKLIALRDTLNDLMGTMRTAANDDLGNRQVNALQKSLIAKYHDYVKAHGLLNDRKAAQVMGDDPYYPRLLALESIDKETNKITPADLFTKRTMFPREQLSVLSKDPKEALYQVLNERGNPDLDYMAGLSGRTKDELAQELQKSGLVFRDPISGNYQMREQYLSGYVRDKLADAKAAVAQGSKEYQANVEALEKVIPKDVPLAEINIRPGATWIPPKAIGGFVRDFLKAGQRAGVDYHGGTWKVDAPVRSAEIVSQYGNAEFPADFLLEQSLNLKQATAYDTVSYVDDEGHTKEKRVVNQERTTLARELQDKLSEEFARWMREHKELAPKLERIYNDTYNGLVTPQYDGSHMSFPGMNTATLRNGSLMPHQKNAVWRLVQDGRGLLAHVVGAGKTYEMIAAGMEMKRLGNAKKILYAVPNHLVGQWAESFAKLYPGSNVLVPGEEDFGATNRRKTMAKIATNDWDAIIMPHSHFNLMDISQERQKVTMEKDLDELEETIRGLQAASDGSQSSKRNVKQMEKSKANLEAKIARLSSMKSDKTINFDDTGIDTLFVDEAHEYKNLLFYTKMNRVAGLAQGEAMRATRLKMKTDYLLDKNGNRGVIFATGTPVQNTMAEMYNMTRYVAPDVLHKAGIRYFDDWAANFGKIITAMQLSPDAETYKPRSKFAEFVNLPELQMMFTRFADVKTVDDLPELKDLLPKLEGGKPTFVEIDNPEIEPLVKQLVRRAAALRGDPVPVLDEAGKPVIEDYKDPKTGEMKRRAKTEILPKPKPEEDNMLVVVNDGRLGATDLRLLNPSASGKYGKINKAAETIHKEWKGSAANRGTQLVFIDRYRHVDHATGEEKINLYRELTKKLVDAGIPKDQIAVIHDAKGDDDKLRLFEKVNQGKVRVLLGSTQKMGAGMNAQTRMIALHHIDLPWKPGELEQREGRIIRQGNENPEVRIYYHLTKRSFDAYMADTLQTKAKFIWQAISGKDVGRSITDAASDAVLSYEEMKAISSGNPDIKRKMEIEAKIRKLETLERQHAASVLERKGLIEQEQSRIGKFHAASEAAQQTLDNYRRVVGIEGKAFSLDILGKKFADRTEATEWLKTQDVPTMNLHATVDGVPITIRTFDDWNKPVMEYMVPYPTLWRSGSGSGPEAISGTQNSWHTAPERTLESAVRSIESVLRALPAQIESLRAATEFRTSKVARLQELAKDDKPSAQKELHDAQKELGEVNKRLGIDELAAAHEQEVSIADTADESDKAETLPQRLWNEETGSFVPGKVGQAALKAAKPIADYLRHEIDANKIARELHSGMYDHESQHSAEVLRAVEAMEKAVQAYGPELIGDAAAVYHHLEDLKQSLTPGQDKLLDNDVLPVMENTNNKFTELKKFLGEKNPELLDSYVHRVVKGKGGWFDRIVSGQKGGTGRGNLLSKSAPQTKSRTMMAIESPDGERRVVSIKGGEATMWDKGQESKLGPVKNAKGKGKEINETFPEGEPNSAFYTEGKIVEGPDGYDWRITQATTKEIEANTNLEYYHNALASALVSNLQVGKALRGAQFIESFKSSPDFKRIAFKAGAGNPPPGWKLTQLPQLRDYYFEPHTAEVLDWYADRIRGRDPGMFEKVGNFLRTSIFFNPLIHIPNIGVHWAVERGLTGYNPLRFGPAYKSSVRAINAVIHQNEDFKHALDLGAALQSHREETAKVTQLFFDQLVEGLEKKGPWALEIARRIGMSPIDLTKAIYRFSGRATWITNDIAVLQSAYEKEARGMPLAEALKETAKHIPDYRLPVRMFNSHGLAKILSNPNISMFMAYHYGAAKSYGEAAKSALGVTEPATGRSKAGEVAHGWELLAGIGLVTFVLYPLLDRLLKEATGDKNAKIRRAGAATLPYNIYQAATHQKSIGDVVQSVATPAVHTKTAAELISNRDFYTGRNIYDPTADWETQGQQVGRYIMEAISPIGQASRAMEGGPEGKKRFAWSLVGVSFPKTRAERLAQQIAIGKAGTKAESPAERENYVERRDILEELRKGNERPLENAIEKREISRQQAHTIRMRARRTPLEDTVHGFSYSEVWKVYQAAEADNNQEEMQQLQRVLRAKRATMFSKGRGGEVENTEAVAQ